MWQCAELAFEDRVQYHNALSRFGKACVEHRVARFRQIDLNNPHVHHDALEFPDGGIVLVTRLVAGQIATVLQLPLKESEIASQKLAAAYVS